MNPIRKLTTGFAIAILVVFASVQLHAQCPAPTVPAADTNVVINGDFEAGQDIIAPSSGGSQTQIFVAGGPNSSPGTYMVGSISSQFNIGILQNVGPHSGTYYHMIDASTASNTIGWEQTVTVQQDRYYYFSAWMTSIANVEHATLFFEVEANAVTEQISNVFTPPDGEWEQYFGVWYSGTNTTATIRLVNENAANVGFAGNDYGLDDIEFTPSCVGVDGAGPMPDFGGDTLSLCNFGGTMDLNSMVSDDANHTYTWYYEGAQVTNSSTPDIMEGVTNTGTYVVCLDSSSCVQADTVEIVSQLFVDLGPDVELCSPASKVLNAGISVPQNFTIAWFKDGVHIQGESSTSYTATAAGTYRVEVTDNIGSACDGFDEIVITSTVPEATATNICSSSGLDSTTMIVTTSGIHEWWDALTGGISLGIGDTLKASGLTGDTIFYVADTSWSISGAGMTDASASFLSGANSNFFNPHDQNFVEFNALYNGQIDSVTAYIRFINPGDGDLTITLQEMPSGPSTVTTYAVISPGTGIDQYIRVPVNMSISAGTTYRFSIIGNGSFSNYRYDGGSISSFYVQTNDVIEMTSGQANFVYPGLFDWRISSPPLCDRLPVFVTDSCSISSCTVTVIADAGVDQTLDAIGDTLLLDGSNSSFGTGITHTWTSSVNNAGILQPSDSITSVVPAGTTIYYLTVDDGSGCPATDSAIISYAIDIFIPSAFSPNGDNINDLWEIDGLQSFGSAKVFIYNRWGSLIYESADGYPTLWDGKRKGIDMPDAVYYYIIRLNDTAGTEYSGSISLLK